MTIEEAPGRGQARVMGLIALAHGASHFYQLALPPLFPHLKEAFAVSYTELGTLMTVFYVSSGLSQTAAGFLVDRFSARTVLLSGLALLCVAIVLMGFASAFWMLFPLAVLAGDRKLRVPPGRSLHPHREHPPHPPRQGLRLSTRSAAI